MRRRIVTTVQRVKVGTLGCTLIFMSNPIDDLARKFQQTCSELSQSEQRVVTRLTQRLHISRDTNRQFDDSLTFGQRIADGIASFVGSWPFILLFIFFLVIQNRQLAKDRLQAEHDYEVNLKAELEIQVLHQKIDTLREAQWADLVMMQQEQIRLSTQLLEARK